MTYYTSFCIPRLCPLLHTAACATGINHFPASLLHEMKEFIMVTVGRCEAFAVIYLVKLDWFINTVNIAILWGQWGAPCCVPLHILEESCVQCEGLGCSSSLLITHHITFPWIRSAKTVFWQIRSGSLIIISMYAGEFNRVFAEGFCRVKCYTQDQIIFYSFIKLYQAAWSLKTLPWQFWVLQYSTFFCIGQWFLLLPDLVPVWPVTPVKI